LLFFSVYCRPVLGSENIVFWIEEMVEDAGACSYLSSCF
jgi:hypothetical protein